jgi:DNA-3-methyladenine glycosylase II
MSCVIEQQIHYRSSKKMFAKMLEAASLQLLTPENFAQFEAKAFANLKLSINKYETVLSILAYWADNQINWQELPDEEVIERLSSIKGIGKWTIDMILLYTLKRPNIFPVDDYHLKQIMIKLYGPGPNIKVNVRMIEISRTWKNHKSLAVKYLLAWKEQNKL